MTSYKQIIRKQILFALSVIFFLFACKKHTQHNELLFQIIAHKSSNEIIVSSATFYLFDNEARYVTLIPIGKETIEEEKIVRLSIPNHDEYHAIVWGNVKNTDWVSFPSEGEGASQMLIKPIQDADGYSVPFDKLFYAKKIISSEQHVEKIRISPKTAQINLTVTGLPKQESEKKYYFTLETAYNGYNFEGDPQAEKAILKLDGIFNNNNNLVTPTTYNTTAYPTNEHHSKDFPTLKLWEQDANKNNKLIVSINKDINGLPISLQEGKVTNILMQLNSSGNVSVHLLITEWDEIHQWIAL